jgi:hypothetical protein
MSVGFNASNMFFGDASDPRRADIPSGGGGAISLNWVAAVVKSPFVNS